MSYNQAYVSICAYAVEFCSLSCGSVALQGCYSRMSYFITWMTVSLLKCLWRLFWGCGRVQYLQCRFFYSWILKCDYEYFVCCNLIVQKEIFETGNMLKQDMIMIPFPAYCTFHCDECTVRCDHCGHVWSFICMSFLKYITVVFIHLCAADTSVMLVVVHARYSLSMFMMLYLGCCVVPHLKPPLPVFATEMCLEKYFEICIECSFDYLFRSLKWLQENISCTYLMG